MRMCVLGSVSYVAFVVRPMLGTNSDSRLKQKEKYLFHLFKAFFFTFMSAFLASLARTGFWLLSRAIISFIYDTARVADSDVACRDFSLRWVNKTE